MSIINKMLNELEKQRQLKPTNSSQSRISSYSKATAKKYYFNLVVRILIVILIIALAGITIIKYQKSKQLQYAEPQALSK